MMLPRLFCQTSYERVCFRSGYRTLTNREPVQTRDTVPAALCQKLIDPMMIFALLGAPSLAQGYHLCRPPIPAPPSNPAQAPHCRWTQSHGCCPAMVSSSPECYKACTFHPSLIQTHHLRTLSPDVLSTKCCPAHIGSVGHPRCRVK